MVDELLESAEAVWAAAFAVGLAGAVFGLAAGCLAVFGGCAAGLTALDVLLLAACAATGRAAALSVAAQSVTVRARLRAPDIRGLRCDDMGRALSSADRLPG